MGQGDAILAGFGLREPEEVDDPFLGEPDHPGGTTASAAPTYGGTAAWHTGHTTAMTLISVLHRGQCRAFPIRFGGTHSMGRAAGTEGPGGGGGTGTAVGAGPGGPDPY